MAGMRGGACPVRKTWASDGPGVTKEEGTPQMKSSRRGKVGNRMSSGSYFPPPARAVPIPKPGGGVRTLGVPTVADRIAQTVVAARLADRVEPMFHPDSYGYPARAVRVGRGGGDPGNDAGARTGCSTWTSGPSSTVSILIY